MRDPAMGEPRKRLTRMNYREGPTGFLADQICKEMQRAGYPAKVHCLYRPPAVQLKALEGGFSKARPFSSAHQYYGAADIIHERYAWFAGEHSPKGDQFWATLWDCVQLVSEKYDVKFKPRLEWDLAHVELQNWRKVRDKIGFRKPSAETLEAYFKDTLPDVWRQHVTSVTYKNK